MTFPGWVGPTHRDGWCTRGYGENTESPRERKAGAGLGPAPAFWILVCYTNYI